MRGLLVLASNPITVLNKMTSLTKLINTKFGGGDTCQPIYLAVQPSIRSQVTPSNVAGWSQVAAHVYSQVNPTINLTILLNKPNLNIEMESLDLASLEEAANEVEDDCQTSETCDKMYSHVVLGGTFDRIHPGHKILLSSALMRCSNSLTVGVTGPTMLASKTLSELILPVEDRVEGVVQFLNQVDNSVEYKVVEITDPFGPSIVDPLLECIVGSQETERGCKAVNQKRKERNLAELDIHLISLVKDNNRQAEHEEEKVSSSTARVRLLGTRLIEMRKPWERSKGPYIVGLTGGSASGKSRICSRLASLGAGVVDCDKLGHAAYVPGTEAFKNIVKEFGQTVVGEDGQINRRALGSIVFGDKSKLELLNKLVWPEIGRLAMDSVAEAATEGKQVVFLDAAVLLEAGWQEMCHEVWVCVVPPEEAVTRIQQRDGKTKEEAEKRINSQMSNQERVKSASTVLCSLWDPEVTQRQVELAYNRLKGELEL